MNLNLPVDFERFPEFRLLIRGLKERAVAKGTVAVATLADKGVEGMAVFIVMRLFVELAYAAQSTNRPGLLTSRAERLLAESLEPLFGDDCQVAAMLKECGLVSPDGVCEVFARSNEHLAGNFKSKELRGAVASALVRGRPALEREADRQVFMLVAKSYLVPDENYKVAPGGVAKLRELAENELRACMRLIKTLDNCLRINGRKTGECTEGLIADAWQAERTHTAEQLREFYIWLTMNRDHPGVPERTEQVLARFDDLLVASRKED